jgi:hypothetical protein
MFQPAGRRLLARSVVLVALSWVLAGPSPVHASDVVLYRVFLLDGTTVVSYGEFARSAGTIVFSMPIGSPDSDPPRLQLVSLPETAVDWARTDAYADAARAKQFADTRGEAEFSRLSDEVASTLNQIAYTADPAKRLALADRARKTLADWPAKNFAYRASDVAQLSAMLDEVVSELRIAAGQSQFDLNLVSSVTPPPPVPMLPAPTLRESIEQAFSLTRTTQDAVQRSSILRSIMDALDEPSRDGGWAAALKARATSELAISTKTDQAYASLSTKTLRVADDRVRKADVGGIEGLIKDVLKADDKLGRQRPQDTAALLATLDARLERARRQRLAADRWVLRQGALRAYERKARPAIDVLGRAKPSFEAIRQLAGPPPRVLRQLQKNVGVAARELALVKPAPELETVNNLLMTAFQMAQRAVDIRGTAVSTNDMSLAWQASSAASGAMLFLDQARDQLQKLLTPPIQ